MPFHTAPRCAHIQITGHQCGSPALKHRDYCYFHERILRGVALPRNTHVEPMFILENEESIQYALMEVMNSIMMQRIEYKTASLLLRALSTAVANSRRTSFSHHPREMVCELPKDTSAPLDEPAPANLPEETIEV